MDLLGMGGPPTRNSAATSDDVPKVAPYFHKAPATNARRVVRYGNSGNAAESYNQQVINALRGMPAGAAAALPPRR